MPLAAFETRTAECDTLVEQDIVANLRRLADHHTHSVIDEQPPSNGRARVDLNAGQESCYMRNEPCQYKPATPVEPVRQPVHEDSV